MAAGKEGESETRWWISCWRGGIRRRFSKTCGLIDAEEAAGGADAER